MNGNGNGIKYTIWLDDETGDFIAGWTGNGSVERVPGAARYIISSANDIESAGCQARMLWELMNGPAVISSTGATVYDFVRIPVAPEHEHHTGPLCAYWNESYIGGPEDPGGCPHPSCMEIQHERCLACELCDYAIDAKANILFGPLTQGQCVVDDLPIEVRHPFGAPGIGHSAQCPNGHAYTYVRGSFCLPEWNAHIGTLADFM